MLNKFGILIILLGIFSFVRKRNHLLISLIRIEFLTIILFRLFIFSRIGESYEKYIRLYYLVIRACEGAIGLRIVVVLTRSSGNDLIYRNNILQC